MGSVSAAGAKRERADEREMSCSRQLSAHPSPKRPSSGDRQKEVIAQVCSRSSCSVLKGTWVCKNRGAFSGPYLRQRRSWTEQKL